MGRGDSTGISRLRTRDCAGFQLLGLNDYSGQGTALVGVLNVHWGEKGYAMASEWREFCSPLVPLAKFPKFVFSAGETLSVPVDIYNALHDTTACIHRLQPPDELKPALKAGTSMG